MKTDELTNVQLEWAVAQCEGKCLVDGVLFTKDPDDEQVLYSPSTDWAQGGRIIEREGISVRKINGKWFGVMDDGRFEEGSTPLIAAMRCYVASKLGDEVEVPKEFV